MINFFGTVTHRMIFGAVKITTVTKTVSQTVTPRGKKKNDVLEGGVMRNTHPGVRDRV